MNHVIVNPSSAQTDAALIPAPGAGRQTSIYGVFISSDVAQTVSLECDLGVGAGAVARPVPGAVARPVARPVAGAIARAVVGLREGGATADHEGGAEGRHGHQPLGRGDLGHLLLLRENEG